MADQQEDDLPQLASLDSGDFIRIVENQATTPVSSIISRALFKAYLDTLYEPVGGGSDGWQTVTETWTRTGNHTFTVATDLTTKYGKATKIRYKDGGTFEYGVIGSSAFGSPNTTINLIPNTSYLMAAGTITETAISYQATPQGFPHWFNWDAAPLGFSVVPSTPIYRYMALGGNTLLINYDEGANGTSNATTFTATLPIASVYAVAAPLGTTVDNSVVLTTPGRMVLAAASTLITFRKDMASAAWTASGGKRAIATLAYEF